MRGFSSKLIALKADVLQDREINCLQARPCIFRPGKFTGCGSEGVKRCTGICLGDVPFITCINKQARYCNKSCVKLVANNIYIQRCNSLIDVRMHT